MQRLLGGFVPDTLFFIELILINFVSEREDFKLLKK